MEEISIGDWAEDSSSKAIEIYSLFIKRAILEDADKQKLIKERGFKEEIIELCNFKSCRPENRELIKELQNQFGEDALLEAGLLQAGDDGIKPTGQLLGAYNKEGKFVNNICIPYFNADGEIFYIRPHKFGLKDKGINIYCPTQKLAADKTWIITESEFKAAAALQYGYPAIGLPGIHSFAVNNFDRLQEFITTLGISTLVIIFDNEIKTNSSFKNYKPNVLKQWDTQWRAIDMCRKLLKRLPDLRSVKIGVLPAIWMVEGKIDIDGALAQGRTESEFKAVVANAIEWNAYLETVPSTGKKIIHRKIYREDFLAANKIKRKDAGYCMERTKRAGRDEAPIVYDESISNFTMEIKKTLIEGDSHIREVIFRGQDGTYSKPFISRKGTNILREFKVFVFSCGDYHFTGKQEDLDLIWQLEGAASDGREIIRPSQIGYLKDVDQPGWLFGNIFIKEDGSLIYPDDEGIIWDGLTGYLPKSIIEDDGSTTTARTAKMPTINLDENVKFSIPEIRESIAKVEAVFDTKAIRLAVGWIIANLFSEEIFRKYQCFPILFIGGKREAGKTSLGTWLMSMAGQHDGAGDSLSHTSQAGAERNLSWFSSLPYWLDEYRNNNKIKKWDGFFRNVYQRQAPSKGTLGSSIRSHKINAGIMLSGEETPGDNALFSRCILINLKSRKARGKTNGNSFAELEALRGKGLLSRLMLEVIKVKHKIVPDILTHIEGWKNRLVTNKVGDRIALNYAIAAVCYDAIFLANGDMDTRMEFTNWVIAEAKQTEKEKESEHQLATFMEDLVTIKDDIESFYTIYKLKDAKKGKARIAIHFPSVYSKWSDMYSRKNLEPFKKATLQEYIKEETFFIESNISRRVKGSTMKCMILSLDPEDNPPDGLISLAEDLDKITETDDGSIDGFGDLKPNELPLDIDNNA